MRRAIMSLRLGIRDFKQARPESLRAMLALVLLFLSLAGCLGGDGPALTPTAAATDTTLAVVSPTLAPSPTPTATDRPPNSTPPPLTSGCTQADVLDDPTPADVGPEPTPEAMIIYITECGDSPKPAPSELGSIYQGLHRYSNHFIEWTPDGQRLMLNAPKESETIGTGIYLVSADGSDSRLLVDASPEYNMLAGIQADLSPDGSTLVYSTCKFVDDGQGVYEIASLSVEEDTPSFLTSSREIDNYPVWSPDGSQVAFLLSDPWYGEGSKARLYIMEADGGDRRNLTPHLNWRYHARPVLPTWSPDGERLAYVQNAHYPSQLYTAAADGSDVHGVTAVTTGASWAPEGGRIAFGKSLPRNSQDDPYSTLCVAELDERGRPRLSQVTATDAFEGPVEITHVNWSPNGDEILFIVGNRGDFFDDQGRYVKWGAPLASMVYLVRPDGTGLRRLLEDKRPYTAAAWSPDSSQIAVRVDPQWGIIHMEQKQASPLFEVLIVDSDGAIQTALGREEILGTR